MPPHRFVVSSQLCKPSLLVATMLSTVLSVCAIAGAAPLPTDAVPLLSLPASESTLEVAMPSAWQEPARESETPTTTPYALTAFQDAARQPAPGSDDPGPDEQTIAERLRALEQNYSDLQKSHAELQESVEGIEDFVVPGHDGETMVLRGRIHADLWTFPDPSPGVDGFETGNNDIPPAARIGFRRLRIGVQGRIWQNMLYRLETEFSDPNDFEFRDAYFGWTELPVVQTVLLGNQKRPYGLDAWNSSNFNIFMERPFIIEAFNQDARRFGLQSWSYSDDLAWNWQYGVFNQRNIQDEGNYISNHWQMQVAGRLANTLWYDECSGGRGYSHWAVAGTWAETDPNQLTENYAGSGISEAQFRTRPEARTVERWLNTGVIPGAENYSLLGLEKVLNLGSLQIAGEYQSVWLRREANSELHFHGGYVEAAYFLTGEYMPWDRETGQLTRPVPLENFFIVDTCRGGVGRGCGAWQIAARWSYGDLADDNIQGGIGESITFGLNWLWNPWARMQFNYIYGNIWNNELNAVGGIDFGDYHVVGTRFMVDF